MNTAIEDAPSLANALGEVEAHARRLGARGNLPVGREVVRESTAVAPVALPPREVETDVHQFVVHVYVSLPQLFFGCRGHRCFFFFFSPLLRVFHSLWGSPA